LPPSPPDWVADTVFYQVFPDRFASSDRVVKPGPLEPWDAPPTQAGYKGGDLVGLAERLDDLVDLGINGLYLNPIFSATSNHRYNAYDYLTVDPLLGGDAALRDLLDAAHARGIRVILDGVFNHSGRGFWPFQHLIESGLASPYRDWFYLDPDVLDGQRGIDAYPVGWRDGTHIRTGYRAWWGIPSLPKLRVEHPAVREYLFGVAEHWLRAGIDGWRLDVPAEIEDPTFWPEFREHVRAVGPDAYLVGEIWRIAPEWLRGDRFDALMNYPLAEAILGYAGGSHLDWNVVNSIPQYRDWLRPLDGPGFAARLMELTGVYDPDVVAVQLNLLGSHDAPRVRTVLGDDLARVRLATLIQATLPGAPCIYYGDEVGLGGGHDPDCRRAFPWDEGRWDRALRDSVQAILRLRAEEPALRDAPLRVVGAEGSAVAFERGAGASRLVVAVNPGDSTVRLGVRIDDGGGTLEPIALPGFDRVAGAPIEDGGATIELEAGSGAVLRVV